MSWFKRSGATAVGPYHRNNAGGLSSSSSAHHIRAAADSGLLLHAVHSLWNSVESVLNKQDGKPSENETAAVLSFVTEVANSLECHNTTAHTQLTDFLLMVDAMNKLLLWTLRFSATIDTESADRLALLQLRVFDLLLNHSERCLLTEKRLIWPLLRLLVACGPSKNCSIEDQLALVLHQLCVGVSQYPASLELLFDTVTAEGSRSEGTAADNNSKFLVFSLLVPYVHREGLIAQQARDDLLLIMSMSSSLDVIGQHIVDKSDFCPVMLYDIFIISCF
jgi:Retinoic acid induced 16-like protein